MSTRGPVSLKMIDKADKEILKLSRTDMGAVFEFQHKFRNNPDSPGLQLKPLSGDSRLWSARVTKDYRALLLQVAADEYLLISVRHRKDVYENLERYTYQINRVSGGIEVIDLDAIGDSIVPRVLPPAEALPGAGAAPTIPVPEPDELFAAYTDEQLRDLGVAEALLPMVRRITTVDHLLSLTEYAPQLSKEVLLALYDGKSYDEVLEFVTIPVKAEDDVDPTDFEAAAHRPATVVTSDDAALQAVLTEEFARWQVFLHPTQRKLVENDDLNGPVRVSGGPGTGKTIVALHRVKHLAERLPPGNDALILLTTFNRNLAEDLRARLKALCEPELVARVEVVNIDILTRRIATEGGTGRPRKIIAESACLREWKDMLSETPAPPWDADFLSAEWNEVIVGQAVDSRAEYFRARRPNRRRLSRPQKAEIWSLAEKFAQRLEDRKVWTWGQVAEQAARRERDRAARIQEAMDEGASSGSLAPYRYKHIVVDEAQDLRPAHWQMLRAMVKPGKNDMFLVGDTHQRIYSQYVTLSSLGVNIRGRSFRLTLNYRTTEEILRSAMQLLTGETYDDLDGGNDTLDGYRSVLRGVKPTFKGSADANAEAALIIGQLRAWNTPTDGSVAIAMPVKWLVEDMVERLTEAGITAHEIGPDGAKDRAGVHVGTMHRFKGLEYQRMILAAVNDGLIPRRELAAMQDRDPVAYQRERQKERSLLFVAATRARDDLAIFWFGRPSPFLPAEERDSTD